jgi:prefoldin subunit 5
MSMEALPSIEELVAQLEKKKAPPVKDKVRLGADELHEPQPEEPAVDVTEEVRARGEAKEGGVALEEVPVASGGGEEEEEKEVQPEEQPAPAVKKDFLAPKFAALSRREKEARERESALEKRLAEIESRAKEIEERAAKIAGVKSPTEALKAYGFSFQDAADDTLRTWKEPEKDPVDVKLTERLSPLDAKLKEIEDKSAKLDAALAEINRERVENQTRQLRNSLAEAAKDGGHELMVEMGDEAYSLAHDVMIEFYKKHAKVLSFKEACDIVEGHYESIANRFTGTQKIKSRFAAPQPASKSAPQSAAKESPKTLTNRLTQGSHAKPNVDEMSPVEARDYLAKQLRFL